MSELSSKAYTQLGLKVGIHLPCTQVLPLPPGVNLGGVEVLGVGAGFCALGGNGIKGSDDWAVRDNGYSLSSLRAHLCGGCLLARCGGGRLPLPLFLQ